MVFSFKFEGDDISEESGEEMLAEDFAKIYVRATEVLPPKCHTLRDLLSETPSQISYEYQHLYEDAEQLPPGAPRSDLRSRACVSVPKRSLFDIRAQLMAEADPESNTNDALLEALQCGDLASGEYEGGFKTWECSLDLAKFALGLDLMSGSKGWQVIELGAGTAIPSMAIFNNILRCRRPTQTPKIRFTLCDYNEDVLRLTTAPNVLLGTTLRQHSAAETAEHKENSDSLDIDDALVDSALVLLSRVGISFSFISGSWGKAFLELIAGESDWENTLILASETIYSPSSTKAFVETVVNLLTRSKCNGEAYIAAKRLYFGVGGGVNEFRTEAEAQGASVTEVFDTSGEGVGRVILKVQLPNRSDI